MTWVSATDMDLDANRVHAPPTAAPLRVLVLHLQPRVFRCVWVVVVGLHCLCAVFLTQLARVYHVLALPSIESNAKLAIGVRYRYIGHAKVVVAIVSALHWRQVFDILWSSLQARRLVFVSPSSSTTRVLRSVKVAISSRRRLQRIQRPRLASFVKRLRKMIRRLGQLWLLPFGRFGVFGIESRVFRAVFAVREMAEVVSQTFQAQRSSELLSRPWLNHLLVALVVINCWSTPIAQRLLGRHDGVERVVCLFIDVMLNIGSSMAIPFVIFLPYYRALSPVTLTFPVELQFSAIWFTRLVMENRLLFSLATSDVLSKLVQHLGIYSSLATVVVLIHPQDATIVSAPPRVQPMQQAPGDTESAVSAPGEAADAQKLKGVTTTSSTNSDSGTNPAPMRSVMQRSIQALHFCFFAWGLSVLAIHIRASVKYHHEVQGCSLATASWFASGYPCSVYNFNCYRQGLTSPNEDSWDHLDPDTLSFIAVTHCSALKMPRSFQGFQHVLVVDLYNNSIVDWTRESAITATKHTDLTILALVRINVSGIPNGLLESLPATLQGVHIAYTNLTTLPANLHTKWSHGMPTFNVEYSQIREFPRTLLSLPVRRLSLHGNLIQTLPELADLHQQILSFAMNANPLVSLPDLLGKGALFRSFSAERTMLQSVPSWLYISGKDGVFLYGTPYCAAQAANEKACVTRDFRPDGKVPVRTYDAKYPV